MKINYKVIICSTNLPQDVLLQKIKAILTSGGNYIIKFQNQDTIKFKYVWRWFQFMESLRTVDGGEFKIIPENKTLVFSYYFSLWEFTIMGLVLFYSTLIDYHALYVLIFNGILYLIKILIINPRVAKQMLKYILESKPIDS